MQINISSKQNFVSESGTKKQKENAKILFGSKGIAILAKLEVYSKEKLLDTAGIDAVLAALKSKDTTGLEKFASSAAGKKLAKDAMQLAKAKTFDAIIKNVKQIKATKALQTFVSPLSAEPKAPVPKAKPTLTDAPTHTVKKGKELVRAPGAKVSDYVVRHGEKIIKVAPTLKAASSKKLPLGAKGEILYISGNAPGGGKKIAEVVKTWSSYNPIKRKSIKGYSWFYKNRSVMKKHPM